MGVTVRIPVSLQKLTQDQPRVEIDGASVRAAVDALEARYPGMRASLMDDQGQVRRFVNIFVNDTDIRTMQGQETPLKDGDELYIVPAIAGGCKWA